MEKAQHNFRGRKWAKKYLGQTLSFTNMESDSITFTLKGRKEAGSTDNFSSSKKLLLSKNERLLRMMAR